MKQKIIIQEVDRPKKYRLKDDVKWVCDSLGLVKGRDIDDTSFKVMYGLLDLLSGDKLISTEEISRLLKIASYRVNHHVRGMMETGILLREKRKIALRGGSLSAAIEEIKRDSEVLFNRLLEVSKKIDSVFKL